MNITDLIARLHPLLVHLPIGILLLAGLFLFLSRFQKYAFLHSAIGVTLFWGMISAIASCISGYLLSGSGDYDEELVDRHMWFGIATAAVSLIAYLFHRWENHYEKWLIPVIVLLIIITGHLGGSLTHGSDYLFKGLQNENAEAKELQPIANVQEAKVYADIIQPLMENKCYTCHNKNKKKGSLRLDEPSYILKGGKDGEIIKPGDAEGSEMIKRLLLPRNDDDHMPPKEKPQLKENEIALFHWWVANGASFDKSVKELEQPDKIKSVLLALQKKDTRPSIPDVPQGEVSAADQKIIQQLKDRGAVIIPVSTSSNYLSANFVTVDTVSKKDIELLTSLKKQLVWLSLSRKNIDDEMLQQIDKLDNLTRLDLDSTLITDKGLGQLKHLLNLQYLNLYGTPITAGGLTELKDLKDLQSIYLYKTDISASDLVQLKSNFPKVILDIGGYKVPMLETDTMIVRPPEKKD